MSSTRSSTHASRIVVRAKDAVRSPPKNAMAVVTSAPSVTAAATPRATSHAVSERSGS